jgi:hypothetical protein
MTRTMEAESSDKEHKELIRQERMIARKYIGKFPLAMAIWGVGNLTCWLALWPLVFTGVLPLWAAFPIATGERHPLLPALARSPTFELRKARRTLVVAQ